MTIRFLTAQKLQWPFANVSSMQHVKYCQKAGFIIFPDFRIFEIGVYAGKARIGYEDKSLMAIYNSKLFFLYGRPPGGKRECGLALACTLLRVIVLRASPDQNPKREMRNDEKNYFMDSGVYVWGCIECQCSAV